MSDDSPSPEPRPITATHPKAPRRERAGVEFPDASWTSFDRYSRYAAIVRAIRSNLGSGRHRVLDVGDSSGWLGAFDPDLIAVLVDPTVDPSRIEGTHAVIGDGANLPCRDRSVPAVVSSDALEHVAPDRREAFLTELARVTDDLLVVAAPFDTPGVAGTEEFTGRYIFAVTGVAQVQLDEHKEHGLPSLNDSVRSLEALGLQVAVMGNGNLHDWLLAMLIKHQLLARPALDYVDLGFDILYNLAFSDRNEVPPYYRHVLIARRRGSPILPATAISSDAVADGVPSVLTAILAATNAEATKQDFQAKLDRVEATVNRLEVQQSTAAKHLMERFSGVEAALASLAAQLAPMRHFFDAARHPLSNLVNSRRTRRSADDLPDDEDGPSSQ